MTSVSIDKQKLLEILKKNREKHHSVFLEALENYRTAAIKELESMVEEAKKPGGRIRRSVSLQQPMDQTADYDRVIMMLELSTDAEMRLTELEFRQYVQDKWSWSRQFSTSNKGYTTTEVSSSYLDSLEAE